MSIPYRRKVCFLSGGKQEVHDHLGLGSRMPSFLNYKRLPTQQTGISEKGSRHLQYKVDIFTDDFMHSR